MKSKIYIVLFFLFAINIKIIAQDFHGVCVGINDYNSPWNDLQFPINDANGIRNCLIEYKYWSGDNIEFLSDDHAEETEILSAISGMPKTTGMTNLFSFAGHGDTDGIVPYFTSTQTHINPTKLQDAFDNFTKFCCILDACKTGIFADSMTSGTILTAVSSIQNAHSYDSQGHGIFTYYVMEGLSDDDINTAEDLFDYAGPMTTAYDNTMTPQIRDNDRIHDFNLLNTEIYVPEIFPTIAAALSIAESGFTIHVTSGNHSVTTNLTVGSGVILDIESNATLLFSSGKLLTVNGTLNTTSATFTGETTSTIWAV